MKGEGCYKDMDLYKNLFGTGNLIFMCVCLVGVGVGFRPALQGTDTLRERERHELRVFENRVLRKIIGPKREEVVAGRRKLHNVEIHD